MKTNGYYHTFYKNRKIILRINYEIASKFQKVLDTNKNDILISSRKKDKYILFTLWNKNSAFNTAFFDALQRLNIENIPNYYEWQFLDYHLNDNEII